MRAPVLIVGIGNILLRDEGIGAHAIEAMQDSDLGDRVEILDGGTSGADLVDEVADRKKVIVIDAIKADSKPGTVFRLSMDDLAARAEGSVSLHEFGLLETMTAAKVMGCQPKEVVIFAVQPKDISPGLELSDEIAAVLPKVVDLAIEEAAKTS